MIQKDVISLREYFERILTEVDHRYSQRFQAQEQAVSTAMAAQEKAVSAAMAAAEKAVSKAEVATEKRLEGVNEFRKSLEDQQNTFVRRDVSDANFKRMEDQIAALSTQLTESKGRGAGRNDVWIILVVIVTLIISVTSIFLK